MKKRRRKQFCKNLAGFFVPLQIYEVRLIFDSSDSNSFRLVDGYIFIGNMCGSNQKNLFKGIRIMADEMWLYVNHIENGANLNMMLN